jgi:regulator of protease activity HflC (stomatin/prohibitin superfamily)
MHLIKSWKIKVEGNAVPLRGHIQHGNRTVVIIEQGHIGYATDNGQPVLLPPGIHVWTSESLDYIKSVPLSDHLIHLGPYTIVTVDEGYVAITQNNGKQIILEGGNAYLLNHINWKFQKFMSMKIQTDDIKETVATSADNIDLSVQSTVIWRITDAKVAATMAAETMTGSGMGQVGQDILKLRNDVLKQALASLSAFVGSVNYSGSFSKRTTPMRDPLAHVPHAQAEQIIENKMLPSAPSVVDAFMDNPIYDMKKMENAMDHANMVTSTYGVEIMSINIITAFPKDSALSKSLASGAVAAANALQLDIDIKSKSKALTMEAKAQAQADEIKARGMATADMIKASAAKDAAILKAEGEAEGIKIVSEAIGSPGGASAMQQQLAIQYLEQFGNMTAKANTIIIPDNPTDVNGVLATAMALKNGMERQDGQARLAPSPNQSHSS